MSNKTIFAFIKPAKPILEPNYFFWLMCWFQSSDYPFKVIYTCHMKIVFINTKSTTAYTVLTKQRNRSLASRLNWLNQLGGPAPFSDDGKCVLLLIFFACVYRWLSCLYMLFYLIFMEIALCSSTKKNKIKSKQ